MKVIRKSFFCGLIFFFYTNFVLANFSFHIPNEDSLKIRNQFLAYPIAYYLPETRWGFGGAGFYNFRFKGEPSTSFPSQLQFAATYTINKQLVILIPFELYKKNNLYKSKGELTYFKYLFNYYGIGVDSKFSDRETFEVTNPRFKIDFLKRINKTFLGVRAAFDNFDIINIKPSGKLFNDSPSGINGGRMMGLGVLLQNDHRDFLFNSTKGHYLEFEIFKSSKYLSSDFSFTRLSFNGMKYVKLMGDHTLAFNVNGTSLIGNPAFYDMAFFGSPKIMRGYQDRRYLDKNMLVVQSEYRFPIYRLLGGVTFLSSGTVANRFSSLFDNSYKFAYGAGLRFTLNKKDRVRLRLDYGRTLNEGGAMYLTVNEAF